MKAEEKISLLVILLLVSPEIPFLKTFSINIGKFQFIVHLGRKRLGRAGTHWIPTTIQ